MTIFRGMASYAGEDFALAMTPSLKAALASGASFGTEETTLERVARAIANFERTILSGRSPFDRRKYGSEESAISEEVKRGFEIFRVSANCEKCHLINESSAPFINNKFHNAVIGGVSKPPR